MTYRLKIETNLSEVNDYIHSVTFTKLDKAVSFAEGYRVRVWILNDESRIVAEWNGICWSTFGVKL
jgi:hypothetical protein